MTLRLLLAKNPAGWLEALDILVPPPVPVLLAVNAQVPDGRDTSWLWDVDYRRLRGAPVFVTGERQTDLAVRLEADEVAFRLVGSVDEAVDLARSPSMEVIANYTAFQQIRAVLGRDGLRRDRRAAGGAMEHGLGRGGGPRGPSAVRLVWVYPDLLSTYGDRGNLLVLARRARLRGIPVEIAEVNSDQQVPVGRRHLPAGRRRGPAAGPGRPPAAGRRRAVRGGRPGRGRLRGLRRLPDRRHRVRRRRKANRSPGSGCSTSAAAAASGAAWARSSPTSIPGWAWSG